MNLYLYIRVLRLDHWIKNVFTLIGSWAAAAYFKAPLSLSLFCMIGFGFLLSCLISSVNYVINEILDSPLDAKHLYKKPFFFYLRFVFLFDHTSCEYSIKQ